MKKDEIVKIKYPKIKGIISLTLIIFLVVCQIISQTSLIRNYHINLIINIIMKNTLNIIVVAIVLFVMNYYEVVIVKRRINHKESGGS